MKNLTIAALLVGGAIVASQSAFGQAVANDLYFGFENQANGGTADYIINLGPTNTIVGKTTVVNLSSDFSISEFDSVLNGAASMNGGVVGAASTGTSGIANTADVYATQLRSGGAGNPATPGPTAPAGITRTEDNNAFTHLGTLDSPAVGTGTLDTSKSWENDVEPTLTSSSFWGITGVDPAASVAPSSVLYLDLWNTVSSASTGTKPFTYVGYFTLDLTGASPKLTFTGVNVAASLSSPKIALVSKVGSTVTVVSSNAFSGHNYQLQYATSMNPTTWANVGSSVAASASTVTNTDTTASGAQRFYRVSAQ